MKNVSHRYQNALSAKHKVNNVGFGKICAKTFSIFAPINCFTMSVVVWILFAVVACADAYFLYRLWSRSKLLFGLYAIFALVTLVGFRIAPLILQYNTQPLAELLSEVCRAGFVLMSIPKLLFAIGLLIDSERGHIWPWLFGLTAVGYIVAVSLSIARNRHGFVVQRVEICSAQLPQSFDGARIALFSDVHIGNLPDAEQRLRAIVDTVNASDVMFVVNDGDLINARSAELSPEIMNVLRGFDRPVYSVMGNHDCGYYVDTLATPMNSTVRQFKSLIDSLEWTRLDDSTAWIRRGTDSIALTGVEFKSSVCPNRHRRELDGVDFEALFKTVPDSAYNIVLSHAPQYWHNIAEAGYGDLTLSGHVHSMQVKWKAAGREFSPARLIYKEWSGLYHRGGNTLYITDGVGYSDIAVRFGTPSQIAIITLRRCE